LLTCSLAQGRLSGRGITEFEPARFHLFTCSGGQEWVRERSWDWQG